MTTGHKSYRKFEASVTARDYNGRIKTIYFELHPDRTEPAWREFSRMIKSNAFLPLGGGEGYIRTSEITWFNVRELS